MQEGSKPGRWGCTPPLAGGGGCAAAVAAHCPSLSVPLLPLALPLSASSHLRIAPAQSECSPKRQSRPGTKSSREPSCPAITAAWSMPVGAG